MILDAGSGGLYIQLFYSPRVFMCVIFVDFWVSVGSWAVVTFDIIFHFILLPGLIQSSFKNMQGV